MVITDQMQCPVHHEMGPVGSQTLALLERFGTQDLWADHQIAKRLLGTCGQLHGGK
jgi:hypothetical protein